MPEKMNHENKHFSSTLFSLSWDHIADKLRYYGKCLRMDIFHFLSFVGKPKRFAISCSFKSQATIDTFELIPFPLRLHPVDMEASSSLIIPTEYWRLRAILLLKEHLRFFICLLSHFRYQKHPVPHRCTVQVPVQACSRRATVTLHIIYIFVCRYF